MRITDRKKETVSPDMIGLFFEDINFAADGGLYAEMIENRSFEAKEAFGTPGNFYAVDDCGYAWTAVKGEDGTNPQLQFVTGDPVSEANPHYLRFTAAGAGQGFANKAYDGIFLKKGMDYKVSFYARCVKYEGENICIEVRGENGVCADAKVKAVKAVPYLPFCDLTIDVDAGPFNGKIREIHEMDQNGMARCNDWVAYETVLHATEDVKHAQFVIFLEAAGVMEFDLISMIPGDAVAGVFRKDLFEALKATTPGFIRFPGGCIVEGISLANRYRWKNTVGALKDRTYIPNLWAFDDDRSKENLNVQRPDAHYGQSYGIGFYEYFLLCELLGAKALPVLNLGAACQFRTTQMVQSDDPAFEEYIQDALDLIEFANGDTKSKWGSLRAQMGHPQPFGLDMIAVGNEQWETEYLDLFRRHELFEKAIHEVYPQMRLLGTAGPILDSPLTGLAWDFYRKGQASNPDFCYAVDEHYYVSPQWMYDHVDLYDSYPREVAVFAGEYAAHTEDKENTMESALAEAALLTGIEKNAGVVKLASYAPLFNRIGHSQWKPDMIWFDAEHVYLTPNYYVQKLFANHTGDYTVEMEDQEKELQKDGVYVSVTRTHGNEVIVKAVNTNNQPYTLALTDEQGVKTKSAGKSWILECAGEKPEGMPEPSKVTEVTMQIDGNVVLPKKSFSVIRYQG